MHWFDGLVACKKNQYKIQKVKKFLSCWIDRAPANINVSVKSISISILMS